MKKHWYRPVSVNKRSCRVIACTVDLWWLFGACWQQTVQVAYGTAVRLYAGTRHADTTWWKFKQCRIVSVVVAGLCVLARWFLRP